jgi:predicted RNase H-like HicB family nuclease/predicted HTH domain antitoxin
MKAKAKRRRAIFERDAEGWWVASVPSVAGCHTQARTLAQARERLKEALAVSVEGDLPELIEEVRLPKDALLVLGDFKLSREAADRALERAAALTQRAAVILTHDVRVSLRDAAELLGLSHQRVAQILEQRRDREDGHARRVRA